jgi:hypothetical protein
LLPALAGVILRAVLLIPKIVNFFTKISDQREREFCSERQLELVDKPRLPRRGTKFDLAMRTQLYIPSFLVRAAGFLPGDIAYVVDADPSDSDGQPACVLLKEKPPKSLAAPAVSIDSHILITQSELRSCGLNGENLDISSSLGKIVIRRTASESPSGRAD